MHTYNNAIMLVERIFATLLLRYLVVLVLCCFAIQYS